MKSMTSLLVHIHRASCTQEIRGFVQRHLQLALMLAVEICHKEAEEEKRIGNCQSSIAKWAQRLTMYVC